MNIFPAKCRAAKFPRKVEVESVAACTMHPLASWSNFLGELDLNFIHYVATSCSVHDETQTRCKQIEHNTLIGTPERSRHL